MSNTFVLELMFLTIALYCLSSENEGVFLVQEITESRTQSSVIEVSSQHRRGLGHEGWNEGWGRITAGP